NNYNAYNSTLRMFTCISKLNIFGHKRSVNIETKTNDQNNSQLHGLYASPAISSLHHQNYPSLGVESQVVNNLNK
ncbi:hypothetical protein TSAR_015406, partial [Trichomalopsis sarcophagae]